MPRIDPSSECPPPADPLASARSTPRPVEPSPRRPCDNRTSRARAPCSEDASRALDALRSGHGRPLETPGGCAWGRAGRHRRPWRPCLLRLHARVARCGRRDRRRRDRRDRRRTTAARSIDATGRYVVPGFIDAHMHLESVKLLVDEFARLVLPLGTTAVVADPHEIANVLGSDGVHWLLDASEGLQLEVYFMAPSCVPASPFESPRRPLAPGDLESLMRRNRVLGLAEMMNFPGVVNGLPSELEKLALEGASTSTGTRRGCGKGLQAYAAAGIRSDHECLTADEGRERLRAGMWLLIREASMARNLEALLPLVLEYGPGRIAFCTDDRDPEDIADNGHINGMVREAVALGVDARGRARDGLLQSRPVARARGISGRSQPATRPTCSCCPTSSASCPTSSSSAAARSSSAVAARSRVGAPDRADQARHRRRLRDPLRRRADPRDRADRGPGRDGVAQARARRRRRATRSPTPKRASPRSPSSSATSRPAASGSASSPARASGAARSPPPSPTTRTTSSSSA